MKRILVVCEGNICRSPMAEALLAAKLPDVKVESAGLGALVGMPADDTAIKIMGEHGIDLSAHRARQITRQMCLAADLVLVMEHEQRQRVVSQYPQASGRVFRIAEHARQDVPDPYRKTQAAFRDAYALIEEGAQHWLERIRRLT